MAKTDAVSRNHSVMVFSSAILLLLLLLPHPAEYVPHGDHVHYVPDHRDAVYGTQVAPGVIIPGAPGSVMPAFGKRKLLAIGSTKAQTTKATEPVKTTTAVKVNDWGTQSSVAALL